MKASECPMCWALAAWIAAAGFASADCPLMRASRQPAVDGVISAGEYDEGVTLAGFLNASPAGRLESGNEGSVTFLSDGKTLFTAWRVKANNVDIGGGLKATATGRDGAVWDDDAVELVLEGDTPGRTAHFIVNSANIVCDRLRRRAGEKADRKWDCTGLRVAGRVLHGWWELEMAIPLASVDTFADGFSVNAARSVPGGRAASLTASSNYLDGGKLRFVWRDAASSVHVVSLGNPAGGEWRPVVALTAGGNVRADAMLYGLKEDGAPERILFSAGQTLAKGDRFEPTFVTRSRAAIRCELTVRDAETGQMLVERTFSACRGGKSAGIPPTAEFDVGEVGEAAVFHYPGMEKMRVRFYPAPGRKVTAVTCALDGKRTALLADGASFTALMSTPGNPGRYPLSFTVAADGSETRLTDVWTLEKKRMEWEGNRIGTEKIVIPPFRPITAEGAALNVILRRYAFGAAGLPRAVEALGRDILAEGGAFYEMETEGRTEVFAGDAPAIELHDGGHDATLDSTATAAGVTLRTKGRFEYDGFLWNEVRVEGLRGRQLERLTLVVPFRDREAPLMHVCTTDSIRFNPAGTVPGGEGVVWDGTRLHRRTGFADPMFAEQVVPYVWLGAERRGLCWFVNNSACLRIAKDRASVRIVRHGDVLRLEIDLVNVPVRLCDGHTFAYGMEATPVKEADRTLLRQFQTSASRYPKGMTARLRARCLGFWNGWARRPYNDDWRMFRACMDRINTGTHREEYVAAFADMTNRYEAALEAYADTLPPAGKKSRFTHMRSVRNYGYTTALGLAEPAVPYMYSDPTLNWDREEAQEYYRSEWVSRPTGYLGANRNFLTPSCIDYCLYYYRKHTELGLKGLYFDDMYPSACRNPDTCAASDGMGGWHGNFGILEMRTLVKRAATMQHLAGQKSRLLQIHMTNCLLVPSFAFATSVLSWEDHYGNDLYQKRFAVNYMRAESLGTQVGAEAMALDGIQPNGWDLKDWRAQRRKLLTRSQQALLLPAGVKTSLRPTRTDYGMDCDELFRLLEPLIRFEVWADDCTFKGFFEDDQAVCGAPDGILTGTYRRPGRVLAIFGDARGEGADFTVRLDAAKLGLRGRPVFRDGETRAPLDGGRVKIPAWDLRIVEITEE